MGKGEFAARKLIKDRKKWRKKGRRLKKKIYREYYLKYDPLEGAPRARAIVIEKREVEQKQPHSGMIKAVRVQIVKNGKQVTAHVPGNRAIEKIDEHDEVIIEWLGGSQKGPIGSMWGIKFKVVEVNGVPLELVRIGKIEKPRR